MTSFANGARLHHLVGQNERAAEQLYHATCTAGQASSNTFQSKIEEQTHKQTRATSSRIVEGNGKSKMTSPPCRNSANKVQDAKVISRTQPNLKQE